ncbi:MAG: toxin-antitoxin system HicB family antitoxin [Bacillota bacterium]|nr:toxin-antitoxin system HicB family antitoxin [Bacillota bacterium]
MKSLEYYMGLNYKVEVFRDESEGGYVLAIPMLKGCVTCSGELANGMEMLEDAKKQWLVAALESGYEIPEPDTLDDYSGQFKLRLPKSLHRELAEKSKQEGISMNQYCLYLLAKNAPN